MQEMCSMSMASSFLVIKKRVMKNYQPKLHAVLEKTQLKFTHQIWSPAKMGSNPSDPIVIPIRVKDRSCQSSFPSCQNVLASSSRDQSGTSIFWEGQQNQAINDFTSNRWWTNVPPVLQDRLDRNSVNWFNKAPKLLPQEVVSSLKYGR